MAIKTCAACHGTGYVGDPPVICEQCSGTGSYETDWVGAIRQATIKLDSIIAEQASQREDLTAALTQIWNKVKDL